LRDPITAATAIHIALNSITARNIDSKDNIVLSITHIEAGTTYNVFPDEAFIEGSIRSYEPEALEKTKSKITQIATSVAEAHGCKAIVDLKDDVPSVVNHKEQADHVIRICKENFG
jgi:metal-dependent amidase/aminoacylase/carboxypeptidase family protein